MKNDKTLSILGRLEPDLIEEAETYRAKKQTNAWVRWGALAACLCLCLAGAARLLSTKQKAELFEASVVTEAASAAEEAAEMPEPEAPAPALSYSAAADSAVAEESEPFTNGFDATEAALGMDEETAAVIALCRSYLYENEPEEVIATVINPDMPDVCVLEELPEAERWLALTEEPGPGPCYEVTFATTEDDLLGPYTLLVNGEKQVIGVYWRE